MLVLVSAAIANTPCSASLEANEGVGVAFGPKGTLHCASPGSMDVFDGEAWRSTPVELRTPPLSYVVFDPSGEAWYAFEKDGVELRNAAGDTFPGPRASPHEFMEAPRGATTRCWMDPGFVSTPASELQIQHWTGRADWSENGRMRYSQQQIRDDVPLFCEDEPRVAWSPRELVVDGKKVAMGDFGMPLVLPFPGRPTSVVWVEGCEWHRYRKGKHSSTTLPYCAEQSATHRLGEINREYAIIVSRDSTGTSVLKVDRDLDVVAHARTDSREGTLVAAAPLVDGEVCYAVRVVRKETVAHDVHCIPLK